MQKLHFSTHINAPREKVWNTMLEKATYKEWTKAFNPSSTFEGSWEEGSEIRFVGSDEEGNQQAGGMYSRIKENRLHEYLSIEHLGIIENGVVDTTSEKVKKWAPSFENYTFIEKDGGTELLVDIDIDEEYKDSFEDMWPKALLKLKEMCESA